MRQSMESYLSRIKNVRIVYEETWGKPKVEDPQIKAALERGRLRALRDAGPKERAAVEKRIERTLSATSVRQYDLIDAYPSFRLDRKERRSYPDGSIEEQHTIEFVHEGRLTSIDLTHGSVSDQKVEGAGIFGPSPVNALGRRLLGTLDQPLSALLELPELTTLGGTETVDGVETVVIKVGPPLPPTHRPAGSSEKNWVKLWLAPSRSYLPLRAEYHLASTSGSAPEEVIHRTELSDFQPAPDVMRGERILFPLLLTFDQPGGKINWRVSRVVLNQSVPADTFRASIPPGLLVTRDGAVPTVRLSGGREAQREVVSETVKSASDILARGPARNTDVPWAISPRVLVPLGLLVVIAGVFVLRRRSHVA